MTRGQASGALLNYTTSIDANKTVGEIQAHLLRHGATKVLLNASSGTVTGVQFVIPINGTETAYRLPANVDACHAALREQSRAGKIRQGLTSREQAERVAWRIVKDWIEAQIAIIETGMVSLEEVMLPYMITAGGITIREMLPELTRRLLPPGGE